MINIDLTLIASIINFFILVWLLKRVLYKPVLKLLAERKETIAEKLQAAEKKEQEIAKKMAEAQGVLTDSKKEARQILENAAKQGETLKGELFAKAQARSQQIIQQAEREAQEARVRSYHQLQVQVGKLALQLAQKLVEELDGEQYEEAMDRLISQLDPKVLEEDQ